MLEALERLGVKGNLLNLIRKIYTNPLFKVKTGNNESEFLRQNSGIRQGCPLFPYLFVLVMTLIFRDIRNVLNTHRHMEPVDGIKFAEILYADDALIFGTHTQSINKMLQAIQKESAYYNMNLNIGKCVNITANRVQSSIRLHGQDKMKREKNATYLGAMLSDTIDNRVEVSNKLAECAATANRLGLFWSKANKDERLEVSGLQCCFKIQTSIWIGVYTAFWQRAQKN